MRTTKLATIAAAATLFALATACGDNRGGSEVHAGIDAGVADAAAPDGGTPPRPRSPGRRCSSRSIRRA